MEMGVAPASSAPTSATWNSTRLLSISTTRSPRRTPIACSPPANRAAWSRYSCQDSASPSSGRNATASGCRRTWSSRPSRTLRCDTMCARYAGPADSARVSETPLQGRVVVVAGHAPGLVALAGALVEKGALVAFVAPSGTAPTAHAQVRADPLDADVWERVAPHV